jgi:hypothetical protein
VAPWRFVVTIQQRTGIGCLLAELPKDYDALLGPPAQREALPFDELVEGVPRRTRSITRRLCSRRFARSCRDGVVAPAQPAAAQVA